MKVIFAGGGTGGHLYPAVAMAEELLKRYPGTKVLFAGTEKGIEATEVPRLGYRLHTFRVRGLSRGTSPADLLRNAGVLTDFTGAVGKAASLIKRESPDVIVGTGGFVSAPLLLAAQLLGKKNLIQEQNAFPGVTTRLLSLFASEVHLSFPDSRRFLKRKSGVYVTGNPARSFSLSDRGKANATFSLDPELSTLLVFGGSRGARSINSAVKQWVKELDGRSNVIWQTGSLDYKSISEEFSPSHNLWIGPYINDMGSAYAAADLVLCRAGASTVAELTNLGKPAILVPYELEKQQARKQNNAHEEQNLAQLSEYLVINRREQDHRNHPQKRIKHLSPQKILGIGKLPLSPSCTAAVNHHYTDTHQQHDDKQQQLAGDTFCLDGLAGDHMSARWALPEYAFVLFHSAISRIHCLNTAPLAS